MRNGFPEAALLAMILVMPASVHAANLEISPVTQETPEWCWIAVGEMIFKYFEIPNANPVNDYQCGIVGELALQGRMLPPICNVYCERCPVPAGTASRVSQMLELYPKVLQEYGVDTDGVEAHHRTSALSKTRLTAEIDDGNPVVAGISPNAQGSSTVAAHVALIVGYEDDGDILVINDPFPFQRVGIPDPYLGADGEALDQDQQYRISYDNFRNLLHWSESFTVEKVSGQIEHQQSLPNFCCSAQGRFGPFPNTDTPVGGWCHAGMYIGRACY